MIFLCDEYSVNILWDEEVSVWIATSDDVHGLVLEDESFDNLIRRVRLAVPELLAFEKPVEDDISLDLVVHRKERLVVSG